MTESSLWFLSSFCLESVQEDVRQADGVELRIDLLPYIDLQEIARFTHLSVLLTLRSSSHGGAFSGTQEEQQQILLQLAELSPPFMDIEYDLDPSFLHMLFDRYPHIHFILSCHAPSLTIELIEDIYTKMRRYPAYSYKIATTPSSATKALQLALFSKQHSDTSVICMGDIGQFTRILGPFCHNKINYARRGPQGTASGQLSVEELSPYSHAFAHTDNVLYGLIGNPVSLSCGHIYHNSLFAQEAVKALYVKIPVLPEDLPTFLPLAAELGFRGLSVTMPLKEAILPYLSFIDPTAKKIGAVNTLIWKEDGWHGFNTDGKGAVEAIMARSSIQNKRIVILGAGGAARSIAYEAVRQKAEVFIINRDKEKAKQLAALFSCFGGGEDLLPNTYDFIINCCPCTPSFLSKEHLVQGAYAMDIVYNPKETPFLLLAKARGCHIIHGDEMFTRQANAQRFLWDLDLVKNSCTI